MLYSMVEFSLKTINRRESEANVEAPNMKIQEFEPPKMPKMLKTHGDCETNAYSARELLKTLKLTGAQT